MSSSSQSESSSQQTERDRNTCAVADILASLSPAEASALIIFMAESAAECRGLGLDEPVPLNRAGTSQPFDAQTWLASLRR